MRSLIRSLLARDRSMHSLCAEMMRLHAAQVASRTETGRGEASKLRGESAVEGIVEGIVERIVEGIDEGARASARAHLDSKRAERSAKGRARRVQLYGREHASERTSAARESQPSR